MRFENEYELERHVWKEVISDVLLKEKLRVTIRSNGIGVWSNQPERAVEPFGDLVNEAFFEGRVSGEDVDVVYYTDYILYGIRWEIRTPLSMAFEVSRKVGHNHIRRVRKSCDVLVAVFGGEALPFVVGCDIDACDLQLAEAVGVTYLEVPQDP
jgi:hypothetical protein